MDIEKELMEKIKRFEDVKNQIQDLQKKIGGLQEQQRAIYNRGLELKGQIDLLLELQNKEKEDLAKSKTAQLTLPVGVAPVIPETNAPVAEVVAAPAEAPKAEEVAPSPIPLEVQ